MCSITAQNFADIGIATICNWPKANKNLNTDWSLLRLCSTFIPAGQRLCVHLAFGMSNTGYLSKTINYIQNFMNYLLTSLIRYLVQNKPQLWANQNEVAQTGDFCAQV